MPYEHNLAALHAHCFCILSASCDTVLSLSDLQRLDGLHDGGATGDQILDDEAPLAGAERALDRLLRAVVFHLQPTSRRWSEEE